MVRETYRRLVLLAFVAAAAAGWMIVFHGPGADQRRFLEQFSEDVLPLLRSRAG